MVAVCDSDFISPSNAFPTERKPHKPFPSQVAAAECFIRAAETGHIARETALVYFSGCVLFHFLCLSDERAEAGSGGNNLIGQNQEQNQDGLCGGFLVRSQKNCRLSPEKKHLPHTVTVMELFIFNINLCVGACVYAYVLEFMPDSWVSCYFHFYVNIIFPLFLPCLRTK